MPRPNVFNTPTKLWHATEGWRTFPVGETDPGGAWHEQAGGEAIGKASTAQAAKDLLEAEDRLDAAHRQLETQSRSMADVAAAKEAAEGKVAELEQRAIDAEKAKEEAEAVAAEVTRERDAARAHAASQEERAAGLDTALEASKAKVADLVEQGSAANQTIADQNDVITRLKAEVAALQLEIAKVDGNGDGKIGGSKTKTAAAPAAKPAQPPEAT